MDIAYLCNTEVEMMPSCNSKENWKGNERCWSKCSCTCHPYVRKSHSLFSHPRNNRSLSTYAQFRLPLCCIEYTSTIMHTLYLYFLILICGLCDMFWLWSIMPVSWPHCATEGPWFCYSSCSPMFISNFLVWFLNRLVNCQ